jgi:hypothetical protein
MSCAQLGNTGFELGASKTRSGQRTTSIYIPPPITQNNWVGLGGISLNIDKNFRKNNQYGDLINDNFFAFTNTANSNQWNQFSPTIGLPGYPHLHHFGTAGDGTTHTLTRGTWIPMIRPYFGTRNYHPQIVIEDCPVPVELTSFNGNVRNADVVLYWETASEKNNLGFYIERKNLSKNDNFKSVGFVNAKGTGTSQNINNYVYFDKDVTNNTTYQYRLRQVDIDGTRTCDTYADVVTLVFNGSQDVVLEQNTPNPFNNSTAITFSLPNSDNVKLEVIDIYGNVVKVLVDGTLEASSHQYMWDGTNSNGSQVSSGSYIYKLTAGSKILTSKMTLVR